jgi:acyl-CoA synthetase (NDP forming)
LKKGQVNFGASKKVLSRISGLSGRDHTLEAVVRKLGVNRQQSLARVR